MCEDKSTSPVDLAANEESGELLIILGKFTKIPDAVKLEKMSKLLFMRKEYEEKAKEQFRGLLSSLPKDSVSGDKIG